MSNEKHIIATSCADCCFGDVRIGVRWLGDPCAIDPQHRACDHGDGAPDWCPLRGMPRLVRLEEA